MWNYAEENKMFISRLFRWKVWWNIKIAYHPKLVLTSIHFPIRDSTTVLFYPWELPRNRLLIVSKRLSLGVYRTLLPTRILRRYPKPSSLVPKNMPHLSHPPKRNTKYGHENVEERARGSKNVPIQICQPFLNRLVMCIECAALSEIKHYSYIWPSHLQLCGRFERS